MSEKIDQIVEELKTLTLLEASELVTKIEETFNVDATKALNSDAEKDFKKVDTVVLNLDSTPKEKLEKPEDACNVTEKVEIVEQMIVVLVKIKKSYPVAVDIVEKIAIMSIRLLRSFTFL